MAKQKLGVRSARFDSAAFERAFLAADYDRCREIVAAAPPSDAVALALSRVDLRDGRGVDVVERLADVRPADARLRAERDIWLGAAYASTGDADSAL
ncbi:MAG TPA: hypothetical protein VKT72_02405, partial [Candidatus Baltobacteraceae bacterium]|nr:hypothetical protein [Candidatus Baltobacteraceae bacterium]